MNGESAPEYSASEVVVTATKTDIDKKNLPSAVEVITRRDIESRGLRNLGEVLNSAAGISPIRSTGRQAVSIRGFESRFSLILLDGKRIASEVDQNYELDRISLDNVERIEIVRGPVSSLYGTDGLGGVVNIITKSPGKKRLDFGMDFGTHRDRYNFSYDSGAVGKAAFSLSGSWLGNTSQKKENGLTYEPFGVRRSLNARMDYKLSKYETLDFSFGYLNEDTHEYVLKTTAKGNLNVNSHDDNERYEYSMGYTYRKQDRTLALRAYLSDYYKKVDLRNLASSALINYTEAHRKVWGFESRYSFAAGDSHMITVGGEYRPESFRGTAVRTGRDRFWINYDGKSFEGSGIDISYAALYAQDEWQISPKLLAIAALRYDGSSKFESNLSPKLGLTYKAQPSLRFKANVGQGFRSPTPNHLYINSSVVRNGKSVTLIGNPALRPEKSDSYEFAVEKDWGKATGKLTYFHNRVKNLIEEVYRTTTQLQYQNIGKATLKGVEAELTYPIGKLWRASANYMYLDAVNDATGSRLFNRPRNKTGLRLTYDDQKAWTCNLWSDWYSDYLFESSPNVGKSKSYMLWNISAEKKINANLSLLVGVNNLFNYKDDDMGISGMVFHGGIKARF